MMNNWQALQTEWRDALKTGRIWVETDQSFYRRASKDGTLKYRMEDIIDAVCDEYGISRAEIICPNRKRTFSVPRFMVALIASNSRPDLGPDKIGKMMNRDRTTIIHAIERGRELFENDPAFRDRYGRIVAGLR